MKIKTIIEQDYRVIKCHKCEMAFVVLLFENNHLWRQEPNDIVKTFCFYCKAKLTNLNMLNEEEIK